MRSLISLNKRFTGEHNEEFNLRHDWHSLLAFKNETMLKFGNYSKDNFPKADVLLQYFADFTEKFDLNIIYDTNIRNIECIENRKVKESSKKNCQFRIMDQHLKPYNCKYGTKFCII